MKLNKRFFAILMSAVLMLVCAVPAFAEAASSSDILLIAPAPASDADIASASDIIEEAGSKLNQIADINESFKLMGYGMLGIFVVMIIIMIVIFVLNFVTRPRKK